MARHRQHLFGVTKLIFVCLSGCSAEPDNQVSPHFDDQVTPRYAADGTELVRKHSGMTVSEFEAAVRGLSKAEVAARFGRPTAVEGDGAWRYDRLQVFDDDGSFQTRVYVVFDGTIARGAIQ